jgi:O-antigen/teichoic acid export membrane protein
MNVFAYISVFDVFAKLFVAISIGFFPENRLIYYSGFVFLVSLISLIIYYCYCRYSYEVTKGIFTKNKKLFFEIFSFSGWTLLGTAANVLKSNGLNVLLNLFFGTVVNAARGISYQIYAAIRSFTSSLQMAFSPQIIKSYAENNFSYMQKLTLTASKMSYYFMLLLSVPVFVDTNLILSLWLGNNVPEHTISFTKIVILTGLIDNLAAPIVNILYANGKIKMYQIIVSAVMLLVIPLSYLILKLNYPPESALLVSLFLTIIAHGVRLFFLKKYISFHISRYVKEVIIPVFGFTLFLVFSPSIISSISVCKSSIYSYILTIVTIEIIFVIIIYLFGLRTDERNIINRNFKKYRINAKN